MQFESIQSNPDPVQKLTDTFKEITIGDGDYSAYEQLELLLHESGFDQAAHQEVIQLFENLSLLCRSEEVSKALHLIRDNTDIELVNEDIHANMCTIAAGSGFSIAMTEGFSGKEVGNSLKCVLTFRGEHLAENLPIAEDDALHEYKPDTAAVSRAGSGNIAAEDVKMISFRVPITLFPPEKMSVPEQEMSDAGKLSFIVRHYTPSDNENTH
ncbi:MAG: hypothetical protein LR017_04070 [Candidatus Pacebacteria bacterium]|jgi:hypothetical protein|nr:hypothetical protein [Candidatus Paceibacterota bacterium]